MSRILVIQNSCFWNKGERKRPRVARPALVRCFSARKKTFSAETEKHSGLSVICLLLIILTASAGALYLYQVNSLATRGYELKEIESKIENYKKEINNLKIREVELKSMYNIEKATKDLNLIIAPEVSYVDIGGPVAMK